ncbi:P-loop containing nucleoside triphosphate hydrolase [Vigna unguiculata]|uniref:P-loop containing nucleoside triphosphate hydrolase n=1 Tax=Vigna unguiculata TaxID=3917 RepID=A0A4D6NLT4_VIGUN|nr:P-loop containing nucleoside triphosphate hydrolase [Vigna unguiculata]
MLTLIKRFAQHHGCDVWFLAHPRQLHNWVGGPPNLYDITGSAHFINKCDNGIVIHRNRDPEAGPMNQVQDRNRICEMLTLIKRFAQHHGCDVWFLAHPRQLHNWVGGPPNLYDITGSAHFINKCDNGIVIHRNRDPEAGPMNQVQVENLADFYEYCKGLELAMNFKFPTLRQVTALKSQLDEQNKRNEERDKRLDAIMNFFSQNYQGQLPPELTMFNPAPVSDQGSVPTNTTSSGHEENHM